ncbi:DUF4097 family beta strand repeat-containing protein [Colwellia psychrerythraea]|uniref:DUF4097 domain-containing protein n=1 Tax=Colwellia psychrerythraea (strain 34H / ATCC BAA-681) TaxID=167879 RepID=Q47V31_COLP3|nr:DUF4097 family beta strand repeat-containing protein [Colwellia psychrerythraea]AAZ24284.1 hypothetical protein CPS_4697 [Colwellia psychrerythraea 34H]
MLKMNNTFKYAPIALLLMAGGLQAKTINKEFTVANGGLLKIATDVGAIDIETHAKETVLVEVEITGKNEDDMEVSFKNNGDDVTIKGDFDRSGFNFGNNHIRVTYKVTLPQTYNVDLNTSGGSIEIEDLEGEVDAYTSGGSISLEDIQGNVDIKTSGGSLDLDNITGKIDAHTSGGSIELKLPTKPTKDSKVKTSGGSITAYLVKNVAVNLSAKTSGGRVSSEFTVDGKITKRSIEGTINGGGPELVLKTSGGSVRIKEI